VHGQGMLHLHTSNQSPATCHCGISLSLPPVRPRHCASVDESVSTTGRSGRSRRIQLACQGLPWAREHDGRGDRGAAHDLNPRQPFRQDQDGEHGGDERLDVGEQGRVRWSNAMDGGEPEDVREYENTTAAAPKRMEAAPAADDSILGPGVTRFSLLCSSASGSPRRASCATSSAARTTCSTA